MIVEYAALIPALMLLVLTVYTYISALDKDSGELVWRLWKMIFAIVLTFLTVYMTKVGINEIKSAKKFEYVSPSRHVYNDYDY